MTGVITETICGAGDGSGGSGEMKIMGNMADILESLFPRILESCFLRTIGKIVEKERY